MLFQHAGHGIPIMKRTIKAVVINAVVRKKLSKFSPVAGFDRVRQLAKYLLEDCIGLLSLT